MSDLVDDTTAMMEFQHQLSLSQSRRDEPVAVATGWCLHCEEDLSEGLRWCDARCRDDWEREAGL